MAKVKKELADILAKYGVDCLDEKACWLWTRSTDTYGYGHLSVGGRLRLAHRWIYEEAHGTDPTGKVVMHECDTPRCVNPHHLRLGTQLENIADRVAKRRNGAAYGDRASTAKLTQSDVASLRTARQTERLSLSVLARMYGISKSQASRIVANKSWR